MKLNSRASGDTLRNIVCTFDNGWTLSIGIGTFHYCDNRTKDKAEATATCEIALWLDEDDMVRFKTGDTVQPYFDVAKLPVLMALLQCPGITESRVIAAVHKLSSDAA
jgi:hypothetical protein